PVPRSVEWLWRSRLPRVPVVLLLPGGGFLAWHRHETEQRAELAKSLVTVSEVESLPAAAFLEDFETIRRLGHAPVVDEELLALLQ
ncbi:MAG TPA: hypothetical protein PKA41_19280, partial [Verrucomicrobiota bacterium]|nr:hypothetical protein [Verrucomicrobiota bacterium]